MPAGESLSLGQLGCYPVARVATIVVATGAQSPNETPPGVVAVIVSLVRPAEQVVVNAGVRVQVPSNGPAAGA